MVSNFLERPTNYSAYRFSRRVFVVDLLPWPTSSSEHVVVKLPEISSKVAE